MTTGGMATPSVPPGGGTFAGPAAGAPLPPGPPPHGWDQRRSGPRRGRGLLGAIGIVVALLLGAAALVVALTGVGRQPAPGPGLGAPTPTTASGSTDDADRALCEAIAPLMAESNKAAKEFFDLGEQGTSARDAALPKFAADTKDWAHRAQAILDANPDVQPFLARTLQRYIDDLKLYAQSIRPGPQQTYDAAAWTDSLVAYGGPLATCQDLGVNWSQ
jgi:hypothetical protein